MEAAQDETIAGEIIWKFLFKTENEDGSSQKQPKKNPRAK